MGGAISSFAEEAKAEAKKNAEKKRQEMKDLMHVLETKRNAFLTEIAVSRGEDISNTEVNGGRSVVRQSELRVATRDSPSKQAKETVANFFEAVQGGTKGRKAIVEATSTVLVGSLDSLFGCSKSQAREKRGFVVLFLNFAFVRVDYYAYSYCVSGKCWGAQSSTAGMCYVSDLAVLDPGTLSQMEIDFLIHQNLTSEKKVPKLKGEDEKTADARAEKEAQDDQFRAMMNIKVLLSTNAVLNRIMKSPDTKFEDLTKALQGISKIMEELSREIEKLPQYETTIGMSLLKNDLLSKFEDTEQTSIGTFLDKLEKAAGSNVISRKNDEEEWVDQPFDWNTADKEERSEALAYLKKDETYLVTDDTIGEIQKDYPTIKTGDPIPFDKLAEADQLGISKVFGYSQSDWDDWNPIFD